MTLDLDKRQIAMLREMGVHVWQPPAALAPDNASPALAPSATPPQSDERSAPQIPQMPQRSQGSREPAMAPTPRTASPVAAAAPRVDVAAGASGWRLSVLHPFALQAAPSARAAELPAARARWLVLADVPAHGASADPFDGDAGRLLGNILRGARRHEEGVTAVVSFYRQAPAEPGDSDGPAALAERIAAFKPDLLLIMGRLAAQTLLDTTEPLGKLRGRLHALHGVPALVTYDAVSLLRSPADKAKTWEDLVLALHQPPLQANLSAAIS
ncbi:MAG: uracil-DNA glycosylase family protein [Pseudomonadota bacterium]